MDNLELNVKGMSCQGCVASVTRVLKAVPGVDDVSVTLQPPLARVTYDGTRTNAAVLKAAVEDAGYGVAP
ncbi:MAG TPA: heavy-metal-associated domain-containing protein [Casimicrobiaceae bacterium]|nr:heavy-metal-associated domain-containing protein [Casimicrobiaceae bacterium]